ncbi:Uncharacterized protein Adt_38659 [Abeliophyllum distichum]|uniref:Uncharacterized protein n=1 Tax=Abeliophyllum distichum TaxID=126358 RepID=A0ABD1Q2W2_9LAMI
MLDFQDSRRTDHSSGRDVGRTTLSVAKLICWTEGWQLTEVAQVIGGGGCDLFDGRRLEQIEIWRWTGDEENEVVMARGLEGWWLALIFRRGRCRMKRNKAGTMPVACPYCVSDD